MFEELSPPYKTIVADPPWEEITGGATTRGPSGELTLGSGARRRTFPYSTMAVEEITVLPVQELAAKDAHLYLWTTNRFLEDAYNIARVWGFVPSKPLIWCKPPHGGFMGQPYGGSSVEFCLYAKRGSLAATGNAGRQWWEWPRGAHSVKPGGFMDIVEQVSPGPYLELFARQPRLGWDAWGFGHETPKVQAS